MRSAIVLVLLFSCDDTPATVEDHCTEGCRFYSECDPTLEPLEPECISSCRERFLDTERIVAACARSSPRHPADQFRQIPSVRESVIEAAECTRDEGCPPDMPDMNAVDPCEGIEQACLDGLTEQDICSRGYQIATFECSETYQACIDRGDDPGLCQTQYSGCYDEAYRRLNDCNT